MEQVYFKAAPGGNARFQFITVTIHHYKVLFVQTIPILDSFLLSPLYFQVSWSPYLHAINLVVISMVSLEKALSSYFFKDISGPPKCKRRLFVKWSLSLNTISAKPFNEIVKEGSL